MTHLDAAVSGHPVLLLPVTKTEPESLSGDETDVSDAHADGVSLPLWDSSNDHVTRAANRMTSSPGGVKVCVWMTLT